MTTLTYIFQSNDRFYDSGLAAGFGEEMLFRGILQSGLASQMGNVAGVIVASVIFGALHAVTPMYAFLAWLASLYFGYLYLASGNLAVPIFTHAIYDVGALFYAHWVRVFVAFVEPRIANLRTLTFLLGCYPLFCL